MSSPFNAPIEAANSQSLYTLVIDPHIQNAIWAIMGAVGVVLVMMIIDMIKDHNAEAGALQAKPARSRKAPPPKDEE